jgi:hypothetical protein
MPIENILNTENADKQVKIISKGRDTGLHARRNKCLLDRYYYYNQYTEKRYEAIVEHLRSEFFLSARTIADLIDTNNDYLTELKKRKPKITTLEIRWPHLKWK